METITKTCDKCREEVDIDEIRFNVYAEESQHPEDREAGSTPVEDEYILCGPCYISLKAWFDPDVDSAEEYMDKESSTAEELLEINEE
jgi:hypothetical protein